MDSWLVILIVADLAFLLAVFWIIVHYRSRRQHQKAEERAQMLGRFEDSESLVQFLESEAGVRYVDNVSGRSPKSSRSALVWVGFLGTCAGITGLALLFFAFLGLLDGGSGFFILGGLMIAAGVGILTALGVALRLQQKPS